MDPPTDEADSTGSFRRELFTIEQLEVHAKHLGQQHHVGTPRGRLTPSLLLPRLEDSARLLEVAYRTLSALASGSEVFASEEWLRDNYHIAQDQIREIRLDLPHRYYVQLPKLADGQLSGYPRVYALARELISHTEGQLDAENLTRFVESYQTEAPLSIGEVWAVPIMLRLVLVEHLTHLATETVTARRDRDRARAWAARLKKQDPLIGLERMLDRRSFRSDRLTPAFVVELLQWLRDQPTSQTTAWRWLEDQLGRRNETIEDLMRSESQREAARQLGIGNVIKSMRLLSSLDWPAFFEKVSLVERVLREDPARAYASMDFATRDRYRQTIEELARRARRGELDVARHSIALAADSQAEDARERHVGYYLISRGRAALERNIGYRLRIPTLVGRLAFRHPSVVYLGAVGSVLVLTIASLLAYAERHGASKFGLIAVAVLSLLPASELVINIVNRLITSTVTPRPLPKLSMQNGIPVENRTMVVVPTMLLSEAGIRELIHHLEIRFLANRDRHLHFAILSDFGDAQSEDMPEDQALVDLATQEIAILNEQYGSECFFLLHRGRQWNERERCWMGWERKRGKLQEFNRLLRGATDTSFRVQIGELSLLPSVRYVITVDTDTELPPDAARRLIGALAHPLNRPRFDTQSHRVVDGYGILQPRVEVNLVSANKTEFARIFSGHVGLDPYTTAASDLYQDLFHEGIYTGKGIYDVDAFEAALAGRVPDNTLLSHDLFEGLYARTGLTSDIHFTDDFPGHYLTWVARLHRWVRGDWQILGWLAPTVPDASGRRVRNTLPLPSRWKILDNLRRSLLPPALLALLVAGWTMLPGSAGLWTTLALLVPAFPAYVGLGVSLTNRIRGVPFSRHLRFERRDLAISLKQALLSMAFLAHHAVVMGDAIGRTLDRLFRTKRQLLEWESAAEAALRAPSDRFSVFRRMWPSIAIGASVLVAVLTGRRDALWWAAPVACAWMVAPEIAFRTSRQKPRRSSRPTESEERTFRSIALQTWLFFDETFSAAHHWLVPDNYQEDRREKLAPRTSPTNIGLQLLATVAAHDFGYVTPSDMVNRLDRIFATLDELQRYRGHFYNWYNTETLAPLVPTYVSTVDSGNLAACLITIRQALREIVRDTPLIDARFLAGVGDMATLLEREIDRLIAVGGRTHFAARRMKREVAVFRHRIENAPRAPSGWLWTLQEMADRMGVLQLLLHDLEDDLDEGDKDGLLDDLRLWLERCTRAIGERRGDLTLYAPWIGQIPHDGEAEGSEAADPTHESAGMPPLGDVPKWSDRLTHSVAGHAPVPVPLREALARARAAAARLIEAANRIDQVAERFIKDIDFEFLFDQTRHLFSIGYSVTDGRLDGTYYDTLASEARLASFVAIATEKAPYEHWFKLARTLAPIGSTRVLLSWSGSMFEYLMPLLVMRSYPHTMLDETYEGVVQRQIEYAAIRGVPWGISESAYAARDLEGNYQYRAFGVPGLGLKRGLGEDLVVAPYACLLAAPIRPHDVARNLLRLSTEGARGRWGLYDALDYSTERENSQMPGTVVRTFMAHHLGMGLVALGNCVHHDRMADRFHADPRVQAAELLLQERVPHPVPLTNAPIEQISQIPTTRNLTAPAIRRYTTPHTHGPRAHLLSNGAYTVMLSNAGGGYSTCHGLALTRWREDPTTDAWGTFCYVRDLGSGRFWSTAYQPTAVEPDEYEVTFAPDRAVFHRRDGTIELHTEIAVSPEETVELRRVSVTNHGPATRQLEITSYAEVVLNSQDADLSHPAFQNLFVETMTIPERDALICWRRSRSGEDRRYLIHVLAGRGWLGVPTEYETDRARFLGRGRTPRSPAAMIGTSALSNTTGAVLDPIVSLRRRIVLPPGVSARLSFTTGLAESEEAARRLIEQYHDRRSVARAFALAGTHSSIELRQLNMSPEQAHDIQRLAARLIYGDERLRASTAVKANRLGPRHLWKHGISGDLPIVLVRVTEPEHVPLVHQVLKAHEYCRHKGFRLDLIVLNEHDTSYRQDLQEQLKRVIEIGGAPIEAPGGVFLRRADLLVDEERVLLHAAARLELQGVRGSLHEQLQVPFVPFEYPPPFQPSASTGRTDSTEVRGSVEPPPALPSTLLFANGLGGFSPDGREYVIGVSDTTQTPAPWSNVIANPAFGFTATEASPGHTWSENSHENRLTPWPNDPVTDPVGECVFMRDEENGAVWSATLRPAPDGGNYEIQHGQGYTVYDHTNHGIRTKLAVFVPVGDPVKISRLRVTNTTGRRRAISATAFVEWVLGETRARTRRHITTELDEVTGAIFARNYFREYFADRVAFLDVNRADKTFTTDRTEFIGRNGSIGNPAALGRTQLSGRIGGRFDPCGALQVRCELEPGESQELIFQLGEGRDVTHARQLIERYRGPSDAGAALESVKRRWDELLGTVQVRTPDPALDLMMNRWLFYQTLSCRYWGRSAYYQSGGALGFRDQLQDVLALLIASPAIARSHIVRAAGRQFVEGDVQHWWHEPGGEGARTKSSDDRLWLAYTLVEYVKATGDRSILEERAPFLEGRALGPAESESYERPSVSAKSGSIYEHAVRAIDRSLALGSHGLPLIGSGDWNDGFNRVGEGGKGESVWLGWFLYPLLKEFSSLAGHRSDTERAHKYLTAATNLKSALEQSWDGKWYRRAYFDDGTPLGSGQSVECQIDSIAQSWAILSGAGDPARARIAMDSIERLLVKRDERLALLLTPPFDQSTADPGYIKGYLPGVRENGGQYTHAAIWALLAFARLQDADRVAELLTILNPINHAASLEDAERYRVEPYVVAADIYSVAPHAGRGGWTWYTGSSGWMYRAILSGVLGVTLEGESIQINPCVPRAWPHFEVTLRLAGTEHHFILDNASNPDGVTRIELDGRALSGIAVPILTDGHRHTIHVMLGSREVESVSTPAISS